MIWDGGEPLAQVDTSGNLMQYWSRACAGVAAWDSAELQERGWAHLVKARVPGSANPDQYLHADWQGTVLASSSASGVGLVQNYPPRAWGQDSTTLAPFSWLGSHGYWYEGQLARSMHYVRARWYAEADPHGWISADPLAFEGGDWNRYRYVGNRPTAEVDAPGLQAGPAAGATDPFAKSCSAKMQRAINAVCGALNKPR